MNLGRTELRPNCNWAKSAPKGPGPKRWYIDVVTCCGDGLEHEGYQKLHARVTTGASHKGGHRTLRKTLCF